MTNMKTLTTIAITTFFAGSAIAQDAMDVPKTDTTETLITDFTAADLDQDGSLNADEFVSFAVMRAEDGDEGFRDVVLAGEYSGKFAAYDADASGGVDVTELGASEKMEQDDMKLDDVELEELDPVDSIHTESDAQERDIVE